ncbi:hypothetical protein QR685DRAFT_538483 [Neurospora intermedia]|uniref:Uncharacterized protein n=1 Tax=Neurospora intermedia TaxID=5142 RepID=A0ABR3CZ42_NEUIN
MLRKLNHQHTTLYSSYNCAFLLQTIGVFCLSARDIHLSLCICDSLGSTLLLLMAIIVLSFYI